MWRIRNHSPIVKSAPTAVASIVRSPCVCVCLILLLSFFFFVPYNFSMNLPAGSISAISPPTGSPLPIGTVNSSTSPRPAFCLCRSLCRRDPEREAARSAFAGPACSCLASARDRRVYRCCWSRPGSGSGYRRLCAGGTDCASAAACVAAPEAAAACPSLRVS